MSHRYCNNTESGLSNSNSKKLTIVTKSVWKKLPTEWKQAPWFGNGLVGSILYKDGENNRFKLQVFRSDVQEHRPFTQGHAGYARCRMQIGSFYIQPEGEITGCDWRLDLFNAQLIGIIETTKGQLEIKHFAHTDDLILYTELTALNAVKKIVTLETKNDWSQKHYNWWNNYYQASFVSLTDTRVETDYWTQMYKLASARPLSGPPNDCKLMIL